MTDRKIKDREIDIQSTKYRVQRDREIPAYREIKRQTDKNRGQRDKQKETGSHYDRKMEIENLVLRNGFQTFLLIFFLEGTNVWVLSSPKTNFYKISLRI